MLYSKIEHFSELKSIENQNITESQQINEFFGLFSFLMASMFMDWFDKKDKDDKENKENKGNNSEQTSQQNPAASALALINDNKKNQPQNEDDENEYNMFLKAMFDKDGKVLSPEESIENLKENFKKEDGSFDEESFNSFKDKQTKRMEDAKNDGTWDKIKNQMETLSPEDREKAIENAKTKSLAIHKAEQIKEEGQKKKDELEAERQAKITEKTNEIGGELASKKQAIQDRREANEKELQDIEREKQEMREMLSHSGDEARKIAETTRDTKVKELNDKLTDDAIKGRTDAKIEEIKQNAASAREAAVAEPNKRIAELQEQIGNDGGEGPGKEGSLKWKADAAANELKSFTDLKHGSEEDKVEYKKKLAEDPNYLNNLKAKAQKAKTELQDAQKALTSEQRKVNTANSTYDTAMATAESKAKQAVDKENNQIKNDITTAKKEYDANIKEIQNGDQTNDPKKIEKKIQEKFKERESAAKKESVAIGKDEKAFEKEAQKNPKLSAALKEINSEYDTKISDTDKETNTNIENVRKEAGLPPQPPKNPNNKQAEEDPKEDPTNEPKEDPKEDPNGEPANEPTNEPKEEPKKKDLVDDEDNEDIEDEEKIEAFKKTLKNANKSDEDINKAIEYLKNPNDNDKDKSLDELIDAGLEHNSIDKSNYEADLKKFHDENVDDSNTEEEEGGEDEEDDNGGKSKTKFRKVRKKVGKGVKIQRWSAKQNNWVPSSKTEYKEWKSKQSKKNESLSSFINKLLYS